MKETYYTTKILKPRFLKMGCKFKKHPGTQFSAGWPDVEIRWKGRVINIEVKMDNNKVTAIQKKELKDIAKHGGYAIVIRRVPGSIAAREVITGIGKKGQAMAKELGAEMQRLYPKPSFVFDQACPLVKRELQKLEEK